uniref:Uncharacterized protein n=1 Tax=viral metagenome TaxID=1070528 RepID=A0A6C0J8Z1_9ZZZZ
MLQNRNNIFLKNKYLKYKKKYLFLKNQKGNGPFIEMNPEMFSQMCTLGKTECGPIALNTLGFDEDIIKDLLLISKQQKGIDIATQMLPAIQKYIDRQQGHQEAGVFSINFSPDGSKIVSCSSKNISIYDGTNFKHLKTLRPHPYNVNNVIFSSDGSHILSTSSHINEGYVVIWNVETGKIVNKFTFHTREIMTISCSSDGSTCASGSRDKTLKIWKIETGQVLWNFNHPRTVMASTFSHNGKIVCSGDTNGNINLYNIDTFTPIIQINVSPGVWELTFSPDDEKLASVLSDNTINVYDVKTGKVIQTYNEHTGIIISVIFSTDNVLFSASEDKTIKRYLLDFPTSINTYDMDDKIKAFDLSPDGNKIVLSKSSTSILHIYDINVINSKVVLLPNEQHKVKLNIVTHKASISNCEFSPDGKTLFTWPYKNMFQSWDVSTGQHKVNFIGHTDAVSGVTCSFDNNYLTSSSHDRTIILWDNTGQILRTLDTLHASLNLTFSPVINHIAGINKVNRMVEIYDIENNSIIANYKHSDYINSIVFSSDGTHIASCSDDLDDKTIKYFNIEQNKIIHTLNHDSTVFCCDFSTDGTKIVSGSDNFIYIWDLEKGELIKKLDKFIYTLDQGEIIKKSDGNIFSICIIEDQMSGDDILVSISEKTVNYRILEQCISDDDDCIEFKSEPFYNQLGSESYSKSTMLVASVTTQGNVQIYNIFSETIENIDTNNFNMISYFYSKIFDPIPINHSTIVGFSRKYGNGHFIVVAKSISGTNYIIDPQSFKEYRGASEIKTYLQKQNISTIELYDSNIRIKSKNFSPVQSTEPSDKFNIRRMPTLETSELVHPSEL